MAEPQELGDPLGEGTWKADAHASAYCLAGNRLSLDVYMDGCCQFLRLFEMRKEEVLQVEFLRLSCNEDLIIATLGCVPELKGLVSLVLKGGHIRDDIGARQRGLLVSLPQEFGDLSCLAHLDLSFNSFTALPPCIFKLARLTSLLVCYNSLEALPEDFGQLTKLTFFSAMKNQLRSLPRSIGDLEALQILDLSENALESLPEEIGKLHNCTELDLSGNQLTSVPSSLANLRSLRQLHLHSNLLVTVPASLACLPNMSKLDLQNNRLRVIPPEIQTSPFVHLRGNPLGEPEVPLPPDESSLKDLRRLFLAAGEDSFILTPDGGEIVLACGVQLCFPRGAATSAVTICFQKCSPDPQWLKLRHHDILLSEVLELQPHGIAFQEEVQIWIPYASPQAFHEREVIIRTFSGQEWSDLETRVEYKGKPKKQHLACCRVPHFSWFLVVSRLVENECRVPQEGALLFSTVDPNIKVTFPPGVTEETRRVKLQVLPMSTEELQEITGDPETVASPLLCLSQNSTVDFLRPVKVQLPLPAGITGLTLDRSKVHLLHGDLNAQNWNDITDQVVLEFTHLYALFEVTHFSWYWLWCTTKDYIGGIAKEVYKRLRMYQVNFIALQRKKDPEQVLLQCVPKHKVDPVLKKLHDRYRGPEPSDMVEMFEGEQFFAAFERGINVDTDRPDCIDGRISFNFFSHLKNVKEVYITSEMDRKSNAVKGQVSFYRGALPENIPEEATKRRKGPDSHWLATLPIKLPKLKPDGEGQSVIKNGFCLPPLNLGNAETGYLTQSNLLGIAGRIGADWQTIGLNLGLSYQQIQEIRYNNREDLNAQILDMLFSWAQQNEKSPDCIPRLIRAMKESGHQDIADEIETIISLGKQKYRECIRRVGLDQENTQAFPDDAIEGASGTAQESVDEEIEGSQVDCTVAEPPVIRQQATMPGSLSVEDARGAVSPVDPACLSLESRLADATNRWRCGSCNSIDRMLQMGMAQHKEYMEQQQRQHEGVLQMLQQQAEQERSFEEHMMDPLRYEARENRRLVGETFREHLLIMRESFAAISAFSAGTGSLGERTVERGSSSFPLGAARCLPCVAEDVEPSPSDYVARALSAQVCKSQSLLGSWAPPSSARTTVQPFEPLACSTQDPGNRVEECQRRPQRKHRPRVFFRPED